MAGQRTIGRYRLIDLTLWLLILFVFEMIVVKAALKFTGQPYWVSVVPAITAIMMMRWGAWGVLYAVAGGIVTCLASGAAWDRYVIYGAGGLLSAFALLEIKGFGKEGIRADVLKTLLYGLTVFILMQLGKALIALCFGHSLSQITGLFAPEVVTLLFTEIIIWTVRRLDGVLEDQRQYVFRVQQEQEKERGRYQ